MEVQRQTVHQVPFHHIRNATQGKAFFFQLSNSYDIFNSVSSRNYFMCKALYKLGARQVMVFGLGPLGCIPLQRVLSISGECKYRANVLSQKFNHAGMRLLTRLSKQLPNSSFIFGDVYDIVYDMISNPEKHGTRLSTFIL